MHGAAIHHPTLRPRRDVRIRSQPPPASAAASTSATNSPGPGPAFLAAGPDAAASALAVGGPADAEVFPMPPFDGFADRIGLVS